VARFIGESTVTTGYRALSGFEGAPEGVECAIRPEFVRLFAPGEPITFADSVEDGRIEGLAFRGDTMEVQVRVRGFTLTTSYSLERPRLSQGDLVKVLIYRLYAFEGDKAVLVSNQRLGPSRDSYDI
jgi:sulfate transport system ATP-binding protein